MGTRARGYRARIVRWKRGPLAPNALSWGVKSMSARQKFQAMFDVLWQRAVARRLRA